MASLPTRYELRLERAIANLFTSIAANPIRYAIAATAILTAAPAGRIAEQPAACVKDHPEREERRNGA